MPQTIKILAQHDSPDTTTLTDIYTVPALTTATVSTVTVCNRGSTAATFRLSAAINGAVDTLSQYLYYDQVIDGNSTFAVTLGITLGAGDKLRFYAASNNTNLSVNVFGIEVS